jgi:hypothetical protein
MSRRAWAGAGIGGLFLLLPLLGVDDYYLHLLIMAGLFFLLAAGMNLLLAAGQLNLGHTAFFGIGAYTSGLLALHFGLSPLLTMPLAAAFTALVGVAVGRLTLKLRGAYFVLVTTGFAEVIRLVATNWMDLTQGPMGLAGVPPFDLGTARWTLQSKRDYYYFMALLAAGTLYLTARLLGSRVGRALAAIRSNEGLGRVLGDQRLSPHHARHGRGLRARRRGRGHSTRTTSRFSRRSCSASTTPSPWRSWWWRAGRAWCWAPRSVPSSSPSSRAAPDGRVLPHAPVRRHPAPRGHVHAQGASCTTSGCARARRSRMPRMMRRWPRSGSMMRGARGAVRRSPCATSRCGSAASPPSRA